MGAMPRLLPALLRAQTGIGMAPGQAAGAEKGWLVLCDPLCNASDGEIEALLETLAVVSASLWQWDPSQGKGGTARGHRRQ